MKFFLIIICLFFAVKGFSQKTAENEVLKISADIFKWEVENKIDSVANILHAQVVVVGSDGSTSQKSDHIKRLAGEDFKHNSIEKTENTAAVSENTVTVIGKGKFDMTVSANKRMSQLPYIGVFTREDAQKALEDVGS